MKTVIGFYGAVFLSINNSENMLNLMAFCRINTN